MSRNVQTRIRTSSEAFALEGHPAISTFQASQADGSAHGGMYYKFNLHNGGQVKVIDPAIYDNPDTVPPGYLFLIPRGANFLVWQEWALGVNDGD